MREGSPDSQGRRGLRQARLDLLLSRAEELEHQLRDVISAVLELVDPDDDLACECRRYLADLDR